MNDRDAAVIVARLSGHFGVATDDVTARDWLALVAKADRDVGAEACEALIAGWTRDRRPRPADWIEAVQQARRRVGLDQGAQRALEPGAAAPPEVRDRALAEMRHKLEEAEGPMKTAVRQWAVEHLPDPVNEDEVS